MVRAKFSLYSKEEITGQPNVYNLKFRACTQHDRDSEQFWKYTPAGELFMQCINVDAANKFEVGKMYYLDFTPTNEKN